MPRDAEALFIVFARAPVPGRVKTRLVPLLGRAGAARLHEKMVEESVRTALGARPGEVELHCAPDIRHEFFRAMGKRFGLRLRAQGRGDLGSRMHRAFAGALRRHAYAVLIGSDSPALRPSDLRAALRALRAGADAVLAPAEDGGYALLGLRRTRGELFDGVTWGGSSVLEQTRRRLARLGWRWRELRTVWDVDRPEDVARLRRSRRLAPLAARLPAARARPTS